MPIDAAPTYGNTLGKSRFAMVAQWVGYLLCVACLLVTGCSEKKETTEETPESNVEVGDAGDYDDPLPFDHRVLAKDGDEKLIHEKPYVGIIELVRSKYNLIHIDAMFELVDEEAAKVFDSKHPAYDKLDARIKDVFRLKTTEELRSPEAKEERREELIATVNEHFGKTVVRNVYFSQYDLRPR